MIAVTNTWKNIDPKTVLFIPAGADIEESMVAYASRINKKIGLNYLEHDNPVYIDTQQMVDEAEVDWMLNEKITKMFFRFEMEAWEIANVLKIPIEYVVDFIEVEIRCMKQ